MAEEQPAPAFARKLALWHTQTFRPIMTHAELEPIMATLGFITVSPTSRSSDGGGWKEYSFGGKKRSISDGTPAVPRVRLPSPRIDGLHVFTYRAFCDAVAYHIGVLDIADIFHVRGMPLNSTKDKPLEEFKRFHDDEGQYFYRDGTLDQQSLRVADAANTSATGAATDDNTTVTPNTRPKTIGRLVALKDIIV